MVRAWEGFGSCLLASTFRSVVETVLVLYEGTFDSLDCLGGTFTLGTDNSELLFYGEPDKRYRLRLGGQVDRGNIELNITVSAFAERSL